MCGFAAFFSPRRNFAPDFLNAVDRDLFHRGPDSGGRLAELGRAIVFRRLAIVDPDPRSDQPMRDSETGTVIAFNGEIYNHLALRRELAVQGVNFRTTSDTETLLAGYRFWGEGVFERLEGMYALVIVDAARGRGLAARDPYGIKPLYMTNANGVLAFASEVHPLLRLRTPEVSAETVAELATFGWAAGRNSNYLDIDRVPGGTLIRFDLEQNRVEERRFLDPLDLLETAPATAESPAAVGDLVEHALTESIHAHLMSDVGYCIQLSGGVDSSLIAAMIARETSHGLKSFGVTLGADQPFDEAHWRRMVVERLGIDHTEVPLSNAEYADALPRAVRHMEGPVPHGACVMLMLLCDRAREASKVILTGEGADEFFGGYERYALWPQLAWQERIAHMIPKALLPDRWPLRGVRRFSGRDGAVYSSVYQDLSVLELSLPDLVAAPGPREAISQRFDGFLERQFAVDRSAYLESLLVRQDKMSMAASVEARVPYVHLPLARIVDSLARRTLAPAGVTKPILKAIAAKYLPEPVVFRRKVGFRIDYDAWLRDRRHLGRYLEWLTEPNSRVAAYAGSKRLRALVDRFRQNKPGRQPPLYQLVNIETWLRSIDTAPRPGKVFA